MATKEETSYNNSGFENLAFGQVPLYSVEPSTGTPGRAAPSPYAPSQVVSSRNEPYGSAPYNVPSTGTPYGSALHSGALHTNVNISHQQQASQQYASQQHAFITHEHSMRLIEDFPDHRCMAWFACLFCFLPLGVFGIIRAHKSQSALLRGDIESAKLNATDARLFSLIAIILGVVIILASLTSFFRYY